MYFTDRGIEELAERRGDETVTIEWVANCLRDFVDQNPSSRRRSNASRRGSPASTTRTKTTSAERRRTPDRPAHRPGPVVAYRHPTMKLAA